MKNQAEQRYRMLKSTACHACLVTLIFGLDSEKSMSLYSNLLWFRYAKMISH